MDYPKASQYLVEMVAKQRHASPDDWDPEFRQYTNGFIDGLTMQYSDMTVTDIRNDVMARAEALRWEEMPWPTWETTYHDEATEDTDFEIRSAARHAGYTYYLYCGWVYETESGSLPKKLFEETPEPRWIREDIK